MRAPSQNPGIMTSAESRQLTTEPPRRPSKELVLNIGHVYILCKWEHGEPVEEADLFISNLSRYI